MAITKEQRQIFLKKAKEHKNKVFEIQDEITKITEEKKQKEAHEKPYYDLRIAEKYMDQVSNFLAINRVAMEIMNIKNEDALNEARKLIYKILIVIEELTTKDIDPKLTEIMEAQKLFPLFSDVERFNFIQRLFFLVDQLEEAYGINSKWKMSFVEIKGRGVSCARNLLDYNALRTKNDPRLEGYSERMKLRNMVEDGLILAAKSYREKYEVSGHVRDDMKKALEFLKALGRLYILENKRMEFEKIKKTIQLWNRKLISDLKKKPKV